MYRRQSTSTAAAALVLLLVGAPQLPGQQAESGRPALPLPDRLPMPTLGGMQFWADELFFHEWRIQRNVVTGHCRLLDGSDCRHAWGSFRRCVERLDEIKRERRLPPMRGKGVVVLHGLGRSRKNMAPLCRYLEREGGYVTFNVGYPSTRRGIAEHARALAGIVERLDGIEEINFVAHSMGNIVIRHYLADQTDEKNGRRPDRRFKRFVMLGPPNHGSIVAARFADDAAFKAILGEAGQELGREWVWLETDLAVPRFEFGIVAGGLANGRGFNPLLDGDDDGVVTVASTRLAGAADFTLVPVLHTFMPIDGTIHELTLRFLQNGCFVSPDQRRPVLEEERANIDD